MLKRFAVKNFRGFPDQIEVDFSRHKDYEFHSELVKGGIVKNGIFYGPNGCGKSNFSMAIFDIVNHLTQKAKQTDYYLNFANAYKASDPVEFEYEFILGSDVVDYKYHKNPRGLFVNEILTVNGRRIFSRSQSGLLFNPDEFQIPDDVRNSLVHNDNNVSVIAFLFSRFPLQQDHYLQKLRKFVESMLWYKCLDTRSFIGLDNTPTQIFEYIIQHNHVKDFQKFLEEVSGQNFNFSAQKFNNRDELFCDFGEVSLAFNLICSTGTNALSLLYFWSLKLREASFVFIDEFDAFYHFALAKKVCEYLFKFDCQVFLSSHNTSLMTNDLLRPDCNFLITKDHKIKALHECTEKELRFGHNIEKLYRGGAFES